MKHNDTVQSDTLLEAVLCVEGVWCWSWARDLSCSSW